MLDDLYENQFIDFKPKHSVVKKVLKELRGVRLFRGGTDEEWLRARKIAVEWLTLGIENKLIKPKNLKIKRVAKRYAEQNYMIIAKAWTFREHNGKYSLIGNMGIDAYQVVKDAIREMDNKKKSMAILEYEMLKSGGMILGMEESSLIVFFDPLGKTIMQKLLSGKK